MTIRLYTPQICLHYIDAKYKAFFDMTPSQYELDNNCVECINPTARPCRFTYEQLEKLLKRVEAETI